VSAGGSIKFLVIAAAGKTLYFLRYQKSVKDLRGIGFQVLFCISGMNRAPRRLGRYYTGV